MSQGFISNTALVAFARTSRGAQERQSAAQVIAMLPEVDKLKIMRLCLEAGLNKDATRLKQNLAANELINQQDVAAGRQPSINTQFIKNKIAAVEELMPIMKKLGVTTVTAIVTAMQGDFKRLFQQCLNDLATPEKVNSAKHLYSAFFYLAFNNLAEALSTAVLLVEFCMHWVQYETPENVQNAWDMTHQLIKYEAMIFLQITHLKKMVHNPAYASQRARFEQELYKIFITIIQLGRTLINKDGNRALGVNPQQEPQLDAEPTTVPQATRVADWITKLTAYYINVFARWQRSFLEKRVIQGKVLSGSGLPAAYAAINTTDQITALGTQFADISQYKAAIEADQGFQLAAPSNNTQALGGTSILNSLLPPAAASTAQNQGNLLSNLIAPATQQQAPQAAQAQTNNNNNLLASLIQAPSSAPQQQVNLSTANAALSLSALLNNNSNNNNNTTTTTSTNAPAVAANAVNVAPAQNSNVNLLQALSNASNVASSSSSSSSSGIGVPQQSSQAQPQQSGSFLSAVVGGNSSSQAARQLNGNIQQNDQFVVAFKNAQGASVNSNQKFSTTADMHKTVETWSKAQQPPVQGPGRDFGNIYKRGGTYGPTEDAAAATYFMTLVKGAYDPKNGLNPQQRAIIDGWARNFAIDASALGRPLI